MRISSAIDLAAIFASPVSWSIFACGQANVLISNEASKRPALLTGLSCDINGICISLRVRIYAAMTVLSTSSCVCIRIMYAYLLVPWEIDSLIFSTDLDVSPDEVRRKTSRVVEGKKKLTVLNGSSN